MAQLIVSASTKGPVLVCDEGLSFWGGVDPETGRIIDAHHPQCGATLAGAVVLMPTSRGSCTGSGVLLELALNGHAPAALIFREAEDILTLGAVIAADMFSRPVAVIRLDAEDYDRVAMTSFVQVEGLHLLADGLRLPLRPVPRDALVLTPADRAMLAGADGEAARIAMQVICTMAASQGATELIDITRAHIDGCIYASPANLRFARSMADMAARVRVPTTMNAISVDHANWRTQGTPPSFGLPASQLADAYVEMGAKPSFTCAPYLLDDTPRAGECIAWAESNAVVFANSVLAARSVKHPDFLDLCMAVTGRAPLSGVYREAERRARIVIDVHKPANADDAFWPMLGYLVGKAAPDRIPLLTGLQDCGASGDDLKALCAAFGTTSAAPMLHIAGITPEAEDAALPGAANATIRAADFGKAWSAFNSGPAQVELVAIGSPHASLDECRRIAALLAGRHVAPEVSMIVTLGRAVRDAAAAEGTLAALHGAGVQVVTDLCWCSITEPVFPPAARTLMTNSGKYAHYAPGLSGRAVRFGGLADCVATAVTGTAPQTPEWLT